MASLKTVLGGGSIGRNTQVFYVYNTSTDIINSGQCCCIVIPAGYTTAIVELWGGGANGGGACCCQWPYSQPTAGSYVESRFTVAAGEYYIVCAAGSTGCSTSCCGSPGNPTFILRNAATVCACAHGGLAGCQMCFFKNLGCTGICVPSEANNSANIGCVSVCSYRGTSQTNNFCVTDNHETIPGSPKYAQNTRLGLNQCSSGWTIAGCCKIGNHFPGGSGDGGSACGGFCCWSGWGAGGLAIVTLYS